MARIPGRARRRVITSTIMMALATAATAFGLVWLVWILGTTIYNGLDALNLKLVTQMTPPPGRDGGLLNAIYGSAVMIGVAVLLGAPIGILAGTHLAEYGRKNLLAEVIRFVNDILLSAPSIVIGLFVYELVVRQTGHFSAWAGAVALAFILLPVVVRTTDETMRLVPVTLREAALALGAPQWKVIVSVLYPAARTGISPGCCWAWRASAARRRRCCSRRSTTSISPPTWPSRWPISRWSSSSTRWRPTMPGTRWPGLAPC